MRQIETSGATRNLTICQIGRTSSENAIRQQLGHIHNLHVVDIKFSNSDAIISLNSVGVALYARTCLKSRMIYKKCKIDFYPDGCAQPLPLYHSRHSTSPVAKPPLKATQPVSSRFQSLENRFEILDLDDTETESDTTATGAILSQVSQSSGGVPISP